MSAQAISSEVLRLLPADAWIVGGAVRDAILDRPVLDLDLVVSGSPEAAARDFSAAVGKTAVFSLSDDFGAWRVVHHHDRWQVDFSGMEGSTIEEDLSRRDLTINAIARPVADGDLIDPFDGVADLSAGRLRQVGELSFEADPLRVMRLVRFAVSLGFEVDSGTVDLARLSAHRLSDVSGERVFMEFSQIISSQDPVAGIRHLEDVGAISAVLPELLELKGVTQSDYHHLDCYEHTLLVLREAVNLEGNHAPLGPAGSDAAEILNGELGDGLSRWQGIRIAAILHDIAKARTRTEYDGGRVGFPGHDKVGSEMAGEILARFRTSARTTSSVRQMIEEHLAAGFLTHAEPIDKRQEFEYLTNSGNTAVDVTVLSVADRLATKGRGSEEAISRHLALTDRLLAAAVDYESTGGLAPLIRGDDLASALGIPQGPGLGVLLAELAAAQYAGEVASADEAVAYLKSRMEAM